MSRIAIVLPFVYTKSVMPHFIDTALKAEANSLRKQGYSYSEIQKMVPVSHATLSRWLREIELSGEQKNRLKMKMSKAALVAKVKNRNRRIEKTKLIELNAQSEIKRVKKDELLLIGTALYWAEGAKQKEYDVSTGVTFSNSDPLMIKVFMVFLTKVLNIASDSIVCEIYVHENHSNSTARSRIVTYWSNITGFSIDKFDKIYFKKARPLGNRKNKSENYFGLLRIRVRKSTDLNRKINGWIKGIAIQCGIV